MYCLYSRLFIGNVFGVQVEALASSAVRAADKLHASLIVAFTSTGRTARIIAKYCPHCLVLAVRRPCPRDSVPKKSLMLMQQALQMCCGKVTGAAG